ncbi:MAG: topoisomerase [Chlamydiales bacterium]|jgi:DNA topoisomerase-3|nr:topoisomerase [Chlamydiales bacterium]
MKVIVTEKPSVARDIAAFLRATKKRDGYFEGEGYQVTWAFGHLVALKDPDEYDPSLKKWSTATLPIIPKRFELKVIDSASVKKQFAVIKRLIESADQVIEATDAGREGELIFRYILSLSHCKGIAMQRLWLNSLTEEAMAKAFEHLRPLDDFDCLYQAARCRSESDWIVGLNATRYLTVKYGFGSLLWSVGRVQTPVLALIVKKDEVIRHFKTEPFWEVFTSYRDVAFKWVGERFKKKEEAEALVEKVKVDSFKIASIQSKDEKVLPPQLYDLTDLQRDMNRRFGLSAQETLEIAQQLYESKAITYPRTDSRFLSGDMKKEVVQIFRGLCQFKGEEIASLPLDNLPFSMRIVNDKKVQDHHAILPTGKRVGELSSPAFKVYEAIVTRMIAAFYPPCLKKVTVVEGNAGSSAFRAKGVVIVDQGWTKLYPKQNAGEDEQELPQFSEGESGPHAPYLKEGKTEPPKHYSENSLLGAMETAGKLIEDEHLKDALKEKGLGTPATRALIIETLIKRGYIEREKKLLKATGMGRFLIALVQDPQLRSAELTGEWEGKLKQIEEGALESASFMQEISEYTKRLVSAGSSPINPQMWGLCPCCKAPVIEGKVGYGCSRWREGCSFRLWREWEGILLQPGDIQQLLQQRVLLRPLTAKDGEPTVLALSDAGEIVSLPLPKRVPFKPKTPYQPQGKGRSSSYTSSSTSSPTSSPSKAGKAPARKGRTKKGG